MNNDDLLEIDEALDMDKLRGLENKFDYFLKENDLAYENKINFNVAYSSLSEGYEIKIEPARKGFDSQEYFMFHFETERGQEKLGKFQKDNNVRFITY